MNKIFNMCLLISIIVLPICLVGADDSPQMAPDSSHVGINPRLLPNDRSIGNDPNLVSDRSFVGTAKQFDSKENSADWGPESAPDGDSFVYTPNGGWVRVNPQSDSEK